MTPIHSAALLPGDRASMRVLHLYSGNLFGGVERLLVSIAETAWTGVEHEFALCFDGLLSEALRRTSARVTKLPGVRLSQPMSVLRARRALSALLLARSFDVVLCHSVWPHCVFAPVIRRVGKPLVLYLHDVPDRWHPYYLWGWRTPPDLCLANSHYTARFTAALRPRVPIEVVHPLVSATHLPLGYERHELRRQLGAPGGSSVILQASRLEAWKGHPILLRALGELRHVPDWQCWIAGGVQRDGELDYRRSLEQMAVEYGIGERVQFIGQRGDMSAVLDACDIYCQPNQDPEPFGIVFVEALYAGKPVIASARGGVLEIVDSTCGVLCEPDPHSVASALNGLIGSSAERVRLASGSKARATRLWSAEAFVPRLSEVLRRVCMREATER